MNSLEYQFIIALNTFYPHGYNLCNGGAIRNLPITKQKISQSNKGKKRTQEQKDFIKQRTIEQMKKMKDRERLAYWKGKKNTQHSEFMKNAFKQGIIRSNMKAYTQCSCGKQVLEIQMSRHLKSNHEKWFKKD